MARPGTGAKDGRPAKGKTQAGHPDDGATPGDNGGAAPITWADLRSAGFLMGLFVACMLLAILFVTPFEDAGYQAFPEPENISNALLYLGLILVFTVFILFMAKSGRKRVIQTIILAAVGLTMAYVLAALAGQVPRVPAWSAWTFALAAAALLTFALWRHPEWYVVDTVGVLVAAGAAGIFGISLGIWPVLVLLVALAVYDAIAVYRTKHMLSLADAVIDLRLPVVLVMPKHRGYSYLHESASFKDARPENKAEREAMFMGLGDLVMPTILVVSALQFGAQWWSWAAALGAAVGTLVGYVVLMAFVLRGRPQAGLPLLNGGAIAGFLVAGWISTGELLFW